MEKSNNSIYINEANIIGHGNPISFKRLRQLDKISENNMCKIYGLECIIKIITNIKM